MAKKYLLYIHDDRFDKETKKSGLVNELLSKHYGGFEKVTEILKKAPLAKDTIEALKTKIDAVCTGHERMRMNCGRKGCPYA